MSFNTQSEKIGLLLNVIDDPRGTLPEVRQVVAKIAEPRAFRRPVIFEGMLFRSIVDAAHYLCYAYDKRIYNWHQHVRYDRITRDVTRMKCSFIHLVRTLLKSSDTGVVYAPSANMNNWPASFKYPIADYHAGAIRDMTDYSGNWM